jgi:sulfate permease, SulP family
VASIALSLSMATAIASGTGQERRLYPAIVGGFLVSLPGGSRFQIGEPAGAFNVLDASCVARNGIKGMIIATFLSRLTSLAFGHVQLGTYIKLIANPATVGFTAGIPVIIFSTHIRDLLGLRLAVPEQGKLREKIPALYVALPTVTPLAVVIKVAVIVLTQRYMPKVPGMLVAVAGAASEALLAQAAHAQPRTCVVTAAGFGSVHKIQDP